MKVVQLENLKAEQIWLYYMARVIIYQDVKKTRWVDEKLHPIKLYRDYNVSQVITAKERSKHHINVKGFINLKLKFQNLSRLELLFFICYLWYTLIGIEGYK